MDGQGGEWRIGGWRGKRRDRRLNGRITGQQRGRQRGEWGTDNGINGMDSEDGRGMDGHLKHLLHCSIIHDVYPKKATLWMCRLLSF